MHLINVYRGRFKAIRNVVFSKGEQNLENDLARD
jgi:hypothetical protein